MDYSESQDLAEHKADVDRMFGMLARAECSIPENALALDVGGGAGMHSAMLAPHVQKVICTDFRDQNSRFGGEFVKLLHEKFVRNNYDFPMAGFEFHSGDATSMIYRDGMFDLVVSFNAFEHIPDPDAALAEMLRVTRPGGLIFLTFDPIWTCDTGSHCYHLVPKPWEHLLLNPEEFCAEIRAAGGSEEDALQFRHAMNKKSLGYYHSLFDSRREQLQFLAEYNWSGCSEPENMNHSNFERCLRLGYSEDELLTRGMCRLIRNSRPC